MDDRHLSVELLRAVDDGEKDAGDLAIVAMAHLFDDCPRCRQAFDTWRRERGEGVVEAEAREYDEAFDRVKKRIGIPRGLPRAAEDVPIEARIEEERRRADRLARELLLLPRRQRLERVRRDRTTLSGPLLADALLERGRRFLPGRSEEAYEAASLARVVLQNERPTALTSELYARALAHQGNARRIQGDLRLAEDTFESARFLLRVQGGGDRLVRAEIDSLEGSLRGAQRRFSEAESLFSRAVITYATEGEAIDVAKTLLSLGVVYRETDDLDRAIEVTNQATELFQEGEHPQLQLMARHNLVSFLIEAGRIGEAKELFTRCQTLYEQHPDSSTALRRLWVEASLARSEGDLEKAEKNLEAVRRGFMTCGLGYDAALAALDLATLYAEQGRTAELKQVADEVVPIFESQDVHREAAAALMLFRDAVRAEQVTLGYVLELNRYLQRARLDPKLQFQVPT